jgi:hypothetical protein
MSRALNLNLTYEQVQTAVTKHAAVISAIEPLYPRGTRVVLKNADQAATLGRALKASLIEGPVVRTPLRTQRA